MDINTDGSLRLKRLIVVFTGHRASPSPNEKVTKKELASSNHITSQEVDDLDFEIELA